MMDQTEQLKARIKELESEVLEREKDLSVYRRELSQANRRLEALIGEINQELRVVHSIQKHLVPTEIPNIQGFEFSSKFVPSFVRGGDYFDVFDHEDRSKFGLILASSTGHVMSALLLSVLLKLTGRMEARRGDPPGVILSRIVEELLPSVGPADKADIFYGSFDRRAFRLHFCRVGDLVALHLDASTNDLKILKQSSGSVDQGFKAEIVAHEIDLSPRDKLILCSRGLVEAKNLEGEMYGQDRLIKTVHEYASRGVHELRNHIFFQIQKFSSGQEPQRDMTVVVAEVKDQVIKLAKR